MGGTGWQDFAFAAAAWTFGVVGTLVLLWAIFWDRSRGRKRCPKCWYDMSGAAGLVCPECGRDARRVRGLHRTRRRWRWGLLGVMLVLGAYPVYHVPIVRRAGWWAAAPTWVLILMAPRVTDEAAGFFRTPTGQRLALAIGDRLFDGGWKLRPRYWFERAILGWSADRALLQTEVSARRLGARISVCLRDDAVERAPEAARGLVALFKAGHTYANAESIVCVGATESEAGSARSFIAFARGVGYFWEIAGPARADRAPEHMVVWGNPDVTKSWNPQSGVSLEQRRGDALDFTSLVYPQVPIQMLGLLGAAPLLRQFHLPDMYDPEWVGVETLNGGVCDHVFAFTLQRERVDVWVERATGLVAKLEYSELLKRGTTTYATHLNGPVDASLLQFEPGQAAGTPLMRGALKIAPGGAK